MVVNFKLGVFIKKHLGAKKLNLGANSKYLVAFIKTIVK